MKFISSGKISAQDQLSLINNVPIFSSMNIVEQRIVSSHSQMQHWGAEQIVIEEGEVGDSMYIIVSGEVVASKWSPSYGWVKVATLTRGDFFGEIAILRNIRRTARVTTNSDCELLQIKSQDFLKIYEHCPQQIRDNIQLIVSKRLKELNSL